MTKDELEVLRLRLRVEIYKTLSNVIYGSSSNLVNTAHEKFEELRNGHSQIVISGLLPGMSDLVAGEYQEILDDVLSELEMRFQPLAPIEKPFALAALSALGQETRLDVFRLLVQQGLAGLSAGVIADRLGILPASLTHHLKELQHAGLITQRRLARQLIYSAEYAAMNGLLAYLTENCCGKGVPAAPVCDPGDSCCSTTSSSAA